MDRSRPTGSAASCTTSKVVMMSDGLGSGVAAPRYAPAWARLGRTYRMMAKYGAEPDPQLIRLAEESLRRALAINPELSLAHYLSATSCAQPTRRATMTIRFMESPSRWRAGPARRSR